MAARVKLAIDANGLVKRYRAGIGDRFRARTAVDGLDLHVPEGTVFGLLGPNGAGKTSTIQMLLGLVTPTSGTVSLLGSSPRDAATRAQVGYVPEKFELPPFMTARAFLQLHLRLLGTVPRGRHDHEADRVLELLSLADRRDDLVGTFSKGMQQRLAIAQAVLGSPRLIVFDEPTSALDPIGRRDVRDLVAELRAGGTTVLLNSHLLAEVEQQCDDVAILERGRLVGHHRVGERADGRIQVGARIAGADDALRARLSRRAGDLRVVDQGDPTLLEVVFSVADEAEVGFVAEEVVAAGATLLALTSERESLEEIFLRTIGVDAGADTEVQA